MQNKLPIEDLWRKLSENLDSAFMQTMIWKGLISTQIMNARTSRGMNQKQFAEFMGVSQGMVSKWENGDYNFTIETLCSICAKLNIKPTLSLVPDEPAHESSVEKKSNLIYLADRIPQDKVAYISYPKELEEM